jgi:hypothetical protein
LVNVGGGWRDSSCTSEGTDAAKISLGQLDDGGYLGDGLNALVGGGLVGSVLRTGFGFIGSRDALANYTAGVGFGPKRPSCISSRR